MILSSSSPVQQIEIHGCPVNIKRDDLIHGDFGGNKWRKLKYNLEHYQSSDYSGIISFGGPFSNHIAALSAACNHYDIPCTGIIRGTYRDPENPTLQKAAANGMELIFVRKESYRLKQESAEIKAILSDYDNAYILPEGGSNQLATKGIAEIWDELEEVNFKPDILFVSAGTGATAAGLIANCRHECHVIVVNTMKHAGMRNDISHFIKGSIHCRWEVIQDYHFGGYAKASQELINFINGFYKKYNIPLDPVYNGKMMYALNDMIMKGRIAKNANILAIHTGGIQGIKAYNYTCKNPLRMIVDSV